MPLHQRLDKKSVIHLHITVPNNGKNKTKQNNDIFNFTCKWLKFKNIILSKVTQTQKKEYGIQSLISGY